MVLAVGLGLAAKSPLKRKQAKSKDVNYTTKRKARIIMKTNKQTKSEYLKLMKMKKEIRDNMFIKYDKQTKRTVTVDYNWLGYVKTNIDYDADENTPTIEEWSQVMEEMLWDSVTLKGIYEPKTLTVNYVCYGDDGRYSLYSKEKLRR